MKRQFMFLAGALCIIATISLLRLNLIDTQYAAVTLSTPQSTETIDNTPETKPSATSTPLFPIAKKISAPTKATTTTPLATPSIAPISKKPAAPANFDSVNEIARNAVVNIVCNAPGEDTPVSGSGVIIDPRGVILTNAHVGQYVLLQDSGQISLSCTARTGSPARDAWHIRVLYISSEWVRDHAADIRQEHPLGTGENDYALLRITESVDGTPLPATLPSLPINTNFEAANVDQSVLIASYPAGFAAGIAAFSNLALISTVTTIKDIFTFSEAHTADLISLGGVIVAQSGSSGGAVVDQWRSLIAIIATASTANETSDRDLRGITLFHINQSMMKETNTDLASYIRGNLDVTEAAFKKGLEPELIKAYIDALMKK
jgi:hypothetical protein